MDGFGMRLKKLRLEKGYNQKTFAELLGITPTRLNYWEKDKREPDFFMFSKIVNILKTDANYLLDIQVKSENDLIIELYSKLDENDKAEIRGEIKQMLKADKYRDSDNELIIHTPRKIAAHGADETKQINPSENPRKIT